MPFPLKINGRMSFLLLRAAKLRFAQCAMFGFANSLRSSTTYRLGC
jgi:hypothetical protein